MSRDEMIDLLSLYPNAHKFVERMRGVDPSYGKEKHQRQFVARMHHMQNLRPCVKDHEHESACYPQAVIEQAIAETKDVR